MLLMQIFKQFRKSINHPSQKMKQKLKKIIRRMNKLPLILRYILAFILIWAGIISLANPLLPGWLMLLVGAKMLSPKYYNYLTKIFKKHKSKTYQQEIFDILSK